MEGCSHHSLAHTPRCPTTLDGRPALTWHTGPPSGCWPHVPSPATCSGLAERQPRQAARWAQHRRVTFLGCLFLPLHCCVLQHQGQLQTNPEPTQSRVLMLICHAVAQTSSSLAPQGWGPPGGWWSRCTAQHYSLIRQVCPEDLWCASRGRRVL